MRASNLIEKSIEQSFKIGKISKTIKKIFRTFKSQTVAVSIPTEYKLHTHFPGAHTK